MSQIYTVAACLELSDKCDQAIRSGAVKSVVQLLADLRPAQVPRPARQVLAKICRRAGMVKLGLRLLQPCVRGPWVPPSAEEASEYAFLLARNGSYREACALFSTIETRTLPTVLLYWASAEIENWNYQGAIPLLEEFLTTRIDEYSKLIAKVNLAASYLAVSIHNGVEALLLDALDKARASNSKRLEGNCLEQLGQFYFQHGDMTKAKLRLEEATKILSLSGSYDHLLVQKWLAAIAAKEQGSIEPLLQFKKRAFELEHWESVREADLLCLTVVFDQNCFDHVYYGSPQPGFRDRLTKLTSASPSAVFDAGDRSARAVFDSDSAELVGRNQESHQRASRIVGRTLQGLLADLYAPLNMGALFSAIYPDEYFDVESSPARTRQALRRTRIWLRQNGIDNAIVIRNGSCHISTAKIAVRYHLHKKNPVADEKVLSLLQAFPVGREFTAEEAISRLGVSRTGLHRLFVKATELGVLDKLGCGRSTVYKLRAA